MNGYWPAFAAWASGPMRLPDEAGRRAHDAFIDTVACIQAGLGTPAARSAAALGGGGAALRAMMLATAGHAYDFDDYDRPSIGHPSTVLVPAILAIAETRPVSGPQAFEAYVSGLEAIDRMGEAVNPEHYERGWHATATLGTIGASVATGRLLGLDATRMGYAMAIAASAAAGLKSQFGTTGKPLHAGFAAMNGINAAMLSGAGASGDAETLDHFAALMGGGHRPGPFGDPLAIVQYGLVVKLWPCCGYLGRLVPAAIALAGEIDAQRIVAMSAELPPRNAAVVHGRLPETPDEARFSVPWCLAAAMIQGNLGPGDFSPETLARADIRALARRVGLASGPAHQSTSDLSPDDPDRLSVTLDGGRTITRICNVLPGDPDHPATRGQLFDKLVACGGGGLETVLKSLDRATDLGALSRPMVAFHAV